jgi:FkbM family methyltransferase
VEEVVRPERILTPRFLTGLLAAFRRPPQQQQAGLAPRDQLSTWVLAEPRVGLRLWVDLGDYGVSRPCLVNRFEPAETAFVEQYLRAGMSFVDIGANIGWFSLIAAKAVGPTGQVVAIEPRPDSIERLAMSARENGFANVRTLHMALAARAGRSKVGAHLAGANSGGTWLITTAELARTMAVDHQLFDVDVGRLDDIDLPACDLLKIDVEGAEHLVLEGGRATLARHRPAILCEINPGPLRQVSGVAVGDYVDLLVGMNYRPHRLGATGRTEAVDRASVLATTGSQNFVFLPI